jgi:hypothetical protein
MLELRPTNITTLNEEKSGDLKLAAPASWQAIYPKLSHFAHEYIEM